MKRIKETIKTMIVLLLLCIPFYPMIILDHVKWPLWIELLIGILGFFFLIYFLGFHEKNSKKFDDFLKKFD